MDWDRIWVRSGGTLPVAASLLVLSAYACGGSTGGSHQNAGAGGSSVSGGAAGDSDGAGGSGGGSTSGGAGGALTSGGGSGGSSGGAGPAGAGGETEASTSMGGGAGAPELACTPVAPPDTRCEYPESLGGGSDSNACGVTPGAWFGIGESELTTWPERGTVTSPNAGLFGSFRSKLARQLEFDAASVPVVAWLEADPAGSDAALMHFARREGSGWAELEAAARSVPSTADVELLVDSAGRLLVASSGPEVSRYADSAWETLGTLSEGWVAGVALGANDQPTILHLDFSLADEADPSADFMVRRWTGSTWEALGILPDNIDDPVLALRANGDPVVAFYYQDKLMLLQWSGSTWEELAGSASGSGLGEPPAQDDEVEPDREIALGVDADDRVLIAWGGNYRHWNGSAWSEAEPVGGPRPRLARNADGALYLMSQSDLGTPASVQERLLYRWSDDVWEPLPPTTAEYTEAIDLAVAPDGTVGMVFGYRQMFYRDYAVGAWNDLEAPAGAAVGVNLASYPGVPEVPAILGSSCNLSQWNGTTWEVVPPPTSAEDCAFSRNSNGDAYLAFWTNDVIGENGTDDLSLRVARQTDEGWEILGDPESRRWEWDRARTRLTIDSQGQPAVVLQTGFEYNYYTTLLRWNGSSWTWWGDSPSVPVPSYEVGSPSLSLTEDDRPVLGVTQHEYGSEQILHVAEWTGEEWRVSAAMTRDDDDDEFRPRLAIDATGAPVVSSPTKSGLELARWSGSAWEQLAPTDDVLRELPLSLRIDRRTTSEAVLFRYFEDCAWRGLSASDHAGGVSNSTGSVETSSVWATEAAVCVHWTEGQESLWNDLLRCHTW